MWEIGDQLIITGNNKDKELYGGIKHYLDDYTLVEVTEADTINVKCQPIFDTGAYCLKQWVSNQHLATITSRAGQIALRLSAERELDYDNS